MATVFTSRQAIQITGVTQRQLAYWRKIGLITPSQQTPGGHSRYTFPDLIALKTAKRLIDGGVSLQKLRSSITALTRTLPHLKQPLTELSLLATGDVILVFHEGAVFETLTGQEWILPIAQFQREVEQKQNARRPTAASGQGELFPETNSA
ncbi:MAG TPA: MerR family transcriptional regulator [Gammaproteobacteria bacterium]|nr:MerR family transcriptional regulator [Gammaproteobacteria bacterium]